MLRISVSQARASFADVVERAAYRKERVLLTRNGKPIAAIVPADEVLGHEAAPVEPRRKPRK